MRPARGQIRRRAAGVAHGERGIALPTVLIVITIGMMLATVGVMAAMGSISNAGRDTSEKSAFGVAEAGAKQALLRQNKVLTNPANGSYNCLVEGSGGTLIASSAQGDGWCAKQTGQINGGTYSYRIMPAGAIDPETGTRLIKIVADGTLNGETRRIQLSAATATGTPAFSGGQMIGLNSFTINGNGSINADVMTNADLVLSGNARVCGDSTIGVGKRIRISGNSYVSCGVTEEDTTVLGPVDRGNVDTVNSNARLEPGGADTRTGRINWDSDARVLRISSNSSLTMGGTNYDLCQLSMSGNSTLYIADGAQVRLYFDSPENCDNVTRPLSLSGNTKIHVTSGDPSDLAILVSGSPDIDTSVSVSGNAGFTNYATIYAPQSDVEISGNGNFIGAAAGKTLSLSGNGRIDGVDSTLDFTADVETVYKPTQFIECTAAPIGDAGTDPSAGC